MKQSPTGLADVLQFPYGASLSDEELRGAVLNSLLWHAGVPHGRIDVIVEQGRVTLVGTVEKDYERDLAEAQAKSVEGVQEVLNGIVVEKKQ
jgi:osmotically-inducible protein OsmY